jgi:hypothetical protein
MSASVVQSGGLVNFEQVWVVVQFEIHRPPRLDVDYLAWALSDSLPKKAKW